MTCQFLFKFSIFIVMTHNSSVNFKIIFFTTLDKTIPSKSQFWLFQVLWWKFAKLLKSFFKPQVSFSSKFAQFFSIMKDNSPLYFCSSNNIYFGHKDPIKTPIFQTFECSDQNLWSCSCQFYNHKSVPLQFWYNLHCHDT